MQLVLDKVKYKVLIIGLSLNVRFIAWSGSSIVGWGTSQSVCWFEFFFFSEVVGFKAVLGEIGWVVHCCQGRMKKCDASGYETRAEIICRIYITPKFEHNSLERKMMTLKINYEKSGSGLTVEYLCMGKLISCLHVHQGWSQSHSWFVMIRTKIPFKFLQRKLSVPLVFTFLNVEDGSDKIPTYANHVQSYTTLYFWFSNSYSCFWFSSHKDDSITYWNGYLMQY